MTRTPAPPPQPPALADAGGVVLPPLPYPPLRVLCVDDNKDAADSLGMLLRLVGFEAAVCHDGATALSVVGRVRPEACVLDLTMPGIDGCELAGMLRAAPGGADLYLVAVTAHDGPAATARTAAAGFDLHLVKPVPPQRLLDVLFDFERRTRTRPVAG
ncbi:MAG: response regulator [Gemmataceae bacterium]|nr:response regulator [Gemmataceae bacterium]